MANIEFVQKELLSKVISTQMDIVDPEQEYVMDSEGEFVEEQSFDINDFKHILYQQKTISELIEFIKKYIFHIGYPGGLFEPLFLESLINYSILASHGIFTRSTSDQFPLQRNSIVVLGDSQIDVFSQFIDNIKVHLFDRANVNLRDSTTCLKKLEIICRNESVIVSHPFSKILSVHCLDSSSCTVAKTGMITSDIVGHGRSRIKVYASGNSNSWVRTFDQAKCEISLSDQAFVRILSEKKNSIEINYSQGMSNNKFKNSGPICVDEDRCIIYTLLHNKIEPF